MGKYHNEWYQKNRERIKPRRNELEAANRRRKKNAVLEAYGGRCYCCGEDKKDFLSVDHVGGGGTKHRKEKRQFGCDFYSYLVRNGLPSEIDGYKLRVACMNCNHATRFGRQCPHVA